MPIVSLRDLYIAELRDLYDVEQHLIHELPALASKATSSALRTALEDHLEQTRAQLERLDLIFKQMGLRPDGARCEAIRGLLVEGLQRMAECERGDVLDATIIGAAQRMEHYEMAAYGCARTYARTLGEMDAARRLQTTLDEEGKADHRLTSIAEHGINHSAGEEMPAGDPRKRSPLRYIDADQLRDFPYRGYGVVNDLGEDLGHLDGLVLECHSGRPVYFVIDSGGWFVGHSYMVPVEAIRTDREGRVLRTTLDKATIHRYPEFNPSAYLTMRDPEGTTEYRPSTWLMTGVWMTEGIGLSPAPDPPPAPRVHEEYPENELMMARGEPDTRQPHPPDSGEVLARETETPKTRDPRLERYRER